MFTRVSCLSLVVCCAVFQVSCGASTGKTASSTHMTKILEQKTFGFAEASFFANETAATESSSKGLFQPGVFASSGYWPASTVVLPARAAVFFQQAYGTPNQFQYRAFDFASSACSSANAFGRYFAAIELLRGSSLSQSERDQIQQSFDKIFVSDGVGQAQAQALCFFFDLISCVADFSTQNVGQFRQASQTGDYSVLFSGATACVAEVLGTNVSTQ